MTNGKADIEFDGGGSGRFPVEDVEREETKTDDKAWPPKDMEAKTPNVEVK